MGRVAAVVRVRAGLLSVGVVVACLTGCVHYTGGAHAIDPTTITAADGWIVARPAPVIRQRNANDCGAAVLAMMASSWQRAWTLDQAVAILPTPRNAGSTLGELRIAARAHGLDAYALAGDRATLIYELEAGRPVVIGLRLPYGKTRAADHYELVVAMRPASNPADEQVVSLDPASGWRARTWTALEAEWQPVGRPSLVVVGPLEPVPQP